MTSPRHVGSENVSLTESMQMVDEIISNPRIDRLEKIQRLEDILSAASTDPQNLQVHFFFINYKKI